MVRHTNLKKELLEMNKLKAIYFNAGHDVLLFFLPLSNLTIKADQTDTSLEDIKKVGNWWLVYADYPPYEFTAKVDGKTEYVGIDIEIAKKLAKDPGKT